MTNHAQPIIVIGAGIVGVSTAIWLRRAGRDVTLIDRAAPGMGASYGNAGVLAACAMVPVTAPGMAIKGPKLLFDPNFPLFLRWPYLPKLAPWLLRYLGHANDKDTRRIATGLATVVVDSVGQHQALAKGTAAEKWLRPSEYSFAYRDRAAFDADAYVWGLRREMGFVPEILQGPDVQEKEPALGPATKMLAVLKNHGYILDPGAYVAALAGVFEAMGGTFVQAEVKDFDLTGGKIVAVDTDRGRFECANAVISTGVWSKPLMKKLGLNVPLESERGYHIVFKNPSVQPKMPIMVASGKFVATPMSQGLRCAGVLEFGGLKAGPSKAPLKLLRKGVKNVFPAMQADSQEEWMGHRPAPCDSLPLIGEIGQTGVIAAFGHHHIGLTAGPKTGRMVADLLAGNRANHDMGQFEPKRFAKRA
jgi:glycine/D-amino acid oxidase-like deaminating enzyme